MAQNSKLGRPPASNSIETRSRIIEVARTLFAEKGYAATSNRALAEEASLTTGAIYHYFDRKLDIFIAVYDETQEMVFSRLIAALDSCPTFVDGVRRLFETSHEIEIENPSLAQFLASARIDAVRDPALADALRGRMSPEQRGLFTDLVALGVRTGEIDASAADPVMVLLRTIVTGLVDEVAGNPARHRQAVDATISLFEGKLVRSPEL